MATALKIQSYPQPLELIKREVSLEKLIKESTDNLFDLMNWNELPESIKSAIYNDVSGFAAELNLQFTAIHPEQKERKKRVCYWVNQFKAGNCSEETACEMLVN